MQQGVNHDFIGFRLGLAARRFLPDDFLQIGTAALDRLGDHLLGALQRKAFRQDYFEFGLLRFAAYLSFLAKWQTGYLKNRAGIVSLLFQVASYSCRKPSSI